jgi:Subtilase family
MVRRQRPPFSAVAKNWITRTLLLWNFVGVQELSVSWSRRGHLAVLAQDTSTSSCDVISDVLSSNCPYLFDGVCDVEAGFCLEGTDCADCEPCNSYKLDCASCVANGCFYCPADGSCKLGSLGADVLAIIQSLVTAKVPPCTDQDDWVQTCATNPANVFTDPLYSAQQWAYQMMRVESVWREGYTGKGVIIRVNDPDGVDVEHPELATNFNKNASCPEYLPRENNATHGTAVASLAVGGSNNTQCAVGIAPGATLSACLGPTALGDEEAARLFLDGLDTTHISINSWNFDACFQTQQRRRFLQSQCPFVSLDPKANPCSICPGLNGPDCASIIVNFCRRNYETEQVGW